MGIWRPVRQALLQLVSVDQGVDENVPTATMVLLESHVLGLGEHSSVQVAIGGEQVTSMISTIPTGIKLIQGQAAAVEL
jgi:hypothetical protein